MQTLPKFQQIHYTKHRAYLKKTHQNFTKSTKILTSICILKANLGQYLNKNYARISFIKMLMAGSTSIWGFVVGIWACDCNH